MSLEETQSPIDSPFIGRSDKTAVQDQTSPHKLRKGPIYTRNIQPDANQPVYRDLSQEFNNARVMPGRTTPTMQGRNVVKQDKDKLEVISMKTTVERLDRQGEQLQSQVNKLSDRIGSIESQMDLYHPDIALLQQLEARLNALEQKSHVPEQFVRLMMLQTQFDDLRVPSAASVNSFLNFYANGSMERMETQPLESRSSVRPSQPVRESSRAKSMEIFHDTQPTSQPIRETSQPIISSPIREPSLPIRETSQPIREISQPIREISQPIRETSQPIASERQPETPEYNPDPKQNSTFDDTTFDSQSIPDTMEVHAEPDPGPVNPRRMGRHAGGRSAGRKR